MDIKSLAGYEFAYVKLMGNTRSAGGSVWKFGGRDTARPAPTPSEIEASCGLTSVSISSSIGADAASYADQELMELVLRATDTADGKTYDYVYRLSGGAGTVPVVTRTKTEASSANVDPTADAGADQPSVASAATVTLDGSGSSDSDGSIASYAWVRNGGTGATVTLSDATAQKPTFTAPTLTAGDPSVTLIFDLVVTDDDGATSTADSVTITVDSGPTVALSGVPTTYSGVTSFDATITFSERVSGFSTGDITVTGGSVTALSSSGAIYTASITTSGNGDLSVSVPADVAQDGSGNGNGASSVSSATNSVVDDTKDQVADLVQNRANNILGTTPNVTGFLNGTGIASRNFNLDATDGSFDLRFNGSLLTRESSKNFAGKTDVWASLLATRTDASTTSSDFVIGFLGAHRFINENLLVGGMVQIDYGAEAESTAGSTGIGRGFMIGPYIAGEIGKTGLRFEGQARWGRSFNTISPIGTYTDGYSTTRWMTRARLEGSMTRGSWTITPNMNLSYFKEVQAAYSDSLTNAIAAQTITLGEVKLGPDFSRTSILKNGNLLQTNFGISAVSNFAVSSTTGSQAFALGAGQVRGRLDFGLSTTTGKGWGLSASGFYDGFGAGGYQSYGGTIKAELEF